MIESIILLVLNNSVIILWLLVDHFLLMFFAIVDLLQGKNGIDEFANSTIDRIKSKLKKYGRQAFPVN